MRFVASVAAMITNKSTRIATFDKIKDFKKSNKSELFFPNKAIENDPKEVREKIQQQNNRSFF
ncbi:hypothetical protein [Polaribacter sp. IC073]|uniref:hypothetical protein n=1 Tax=Polaribacter sp. IC073 TaxID=2508540 RepID=UPI0011BE0FA3|nr:hypothetical protein [Polaribacter sp. IC073]TXD46878.1 hypothetical protein ES045_12975 [Polaribacter sp. IC073]